MVVVVVVARESRVARTVRACEEQVAIGATVVLVVLDVDRLESATDGTGALVSSQDTLSRRHDGILDHVAGHRDRSSQPAVGSLVGGSLWWWCSTHREWCTRTAMRDNSAFCSGVKYDMLNGMRCRCGLREGGGGGTRASEATTKENEQRREHRRASFHYERERETTLTSLCLLALDTRILAGAPMNSPRAARS